VYGQTKGSLLLGIELGMNDLKIYIRPDFAGPDKGEGGIRRWVEAQHRYLPDHGIALVGSEREADMVVCHAADIVNTNKPLVCHNHGLYNTADQVWSKWAWQMNASCIELMRRAEITTVPSRWVRDQMARGMSMNPRVLYAGIDAEEWDPGENGHYVLWNKTRVDPVCNPVAVNQLALLNPGLHFVSTFGRATGNVELTGKLPFEQGMEFIRNAGVYLSTSKETFGISTLEAMACGVPVLGWAFGGNLDIVKHLETGYLAKPNDYDDLQQGLEYVMHHRDTLGEAAREAILNTFTWERSIEECAGIYREAMVSHKPKVAVIVTVYNLEQYLPECLDSILNQEHFEDWECLIVDDCSPGNCCEIAAIYAAKDQRFKYFQTPKNLYLAGARNYGIERTDAQYIIPLDADDMLNPRSLATLSHFLYENLAFAIAYGGMELLEPDGKRWVSTWPGDWSWEYHLSRVMEKYNTLPYCSMYRRQVWANTGGYRERVQTGEDVDFWTRVTSFGFRAKKVTGYPTLLYRNRPDSMSHANEWIDHSVWYPWARKRELAPFGNPGKAPNDMSWPVKTYDDPQVSVIIPVGPGHENVVRDALDSVLAQTEDSWECIVVNDSGSELDLSGYPWVTCFVTPSPKSGPAIARNIGIEAARAPLFVLLDADDYLMPTYLEKSLVVQGQYGGYVYTDYFKVLENGEHETVETPEWEMLDLLYKGLEFAVTCLIPKSAWELVGGFDPDCGGWEDWDLFFAMATNEICGTRLNEPLWNYRYYGGQRREDGYAREKDNSAILRRKWNAYALRKGKKLMGCAGCGKGGGGRNARSVPTPVMNQITVRQASLAEARSEGMTKLVYTKEDTVMHSLRGPRSGQRYRVGGNESHRQVYVYTVDVDQLLKLPFLAVATPVVAGPEPVITPPPMRHSKSRIMDAVAS
jgi:glycosyltransferase involved in cell wall biosynthesis